MGMDGLSQAGGLRIDRRSEQIVAVAVAAHGKVLSKVPQVPCIPVSSRTVVVNCDTNVLYCAEHQCTVARDSAVRRAQGTRSGRCV